MEIKIKHFVKGPLTFMDLEPRDMFVADGRVYMKWTTTEAVCINMPEQRNHGFELQREVKRVVSLEVTVQDA